MKRTKMEKGITLVALIITIIVLLILAVVAITAINNDGIFSHANNAATKFNTAQGEENNLLINYLNKMEQYMPGGTISGGSGEGDGDDTPTVAEVKNIKQTVNTKVVDEFGNQIVIPAGFKIRVDEGTRTKGDEKSTATNVTEGIVIQDEDGNQFVWVPVGKIYTDNTAQKETTAKTITLGKYSNFTATDGVYTPAATIDGFIEEQATDTGIGQYGNAIARNIEDFKTSATQNKGYYIGRFEAGNASNTLVCKTGQTVYNWVTQPNAATACKNMYNNGADGYKANTFSSDLVNSYAWDTAIIFIQTFGGTAASDYNNQNASVDIGEFKTTTGQTGDEYCNINDMSGNAREWSTETSDNANYPGVGRGGCYDASDGFAYAKTSIRHCDTSLSNSYAKDSFRPLLYVAL